MIYMQQKYMIDATMIYDIYIWNKKKYNICYKKMFNKIIYAGKI